MNGSEESLQLPGIEMYAASNTSHQLPVLSKLERATHLKTHLPQMLSGHVQGVFLQMLSHMIKPERILEIGTFTGYSAICLAQGLTKNGVLHTIDCNPEMEEFALPFFAEAGLGNKIVMHIGDASQIISSMHGQFDIVFIDADKDNYIRYFDMVFPLVAEGGYILADNTLWYGRVVEPDAQANRETAPIVAFNEYVNQHSGVENVMLTIRDGITIARKKPV